MASIPAGVRELMWEYDQDLLTPSGEIPRAVIERVMLHGRWADMQWLLEAVDRSRLESFLIARGSRVLPPRELSFWALACGVPESTAAHWRREARRRETEWRG
jgi:hypothetical protein